MSDFTKGQTVFSVDGEQLEFVGKLDGIKKVFNDAEKRFLEAKDALAKAEGRS